LHVQARKSLGERATVEETPSQTWRLRRETESGEATPPMMTTPRRLLDDLIPEIVENDDVAVRQMLSFVLQVVPWH
jgi:hypothetical protein